MRAFAKVGKTESREHLQRMWRSCDGRAGWAGPTLHNVLPSAEEERQTDGRRAFHFSEKGDGCTRKNTHIFSAQLSVIDGHLVLARVNILLIKRRSEYLSFRLTGKPSIATTKNTSLQKGTPLPLDKLSREPTQWRDARCPKHCRPSPSPPPPPRPPNRSLARCRVGRKLNCTIYLHRESSSLSALLCV